MHEQRGNFNGIDTCSVIQFRNFKLISYLLQENESRSLIGYSDINAFLDKFVKAKIISHQFANNYQDTAKLQTSNIDFNDFFMVEHKFLQNKQLKCNKLKILFL